jgi:hypothetical protein
MKLYHVTTDAIAQRIRLQKFEETERSIKLSSAGPVVRVRGVWLSDRPLWEGRTLVLQSPPPGLQVIAFSIPDTVASAFEIVSEGQLHREWCIPAPLAGKLLRE